MDQKLIREFSLLSPNTEANVQHDAIERDVGDVTERDDESYQECWRLDYTHTHVGMIVTPTARRTFLFLKILFVIFVRVGGDFISI